MKKELLRSLLLSAACLALCMLLPFLTGQIPEIGKFLSPMHIPVLLCGFICGPKYGAAVGFIAPLLRSFIFTMPPLFPTALTMAFEMAAYGTLTGVLYSMLPNKPWNVYAALVLSMLGGRIVWGIVRVMLFFFVGSEFSFSIFLAEGFVRALPGILLHIALIPPVVLAMKKARLLGYARA